VYVRKGRVLTGIACNGALGGLAASSSSSSDTGSKSGLGGIFSAIGGLFGKKKSSG
jgi:hypothetical protein